MALQLRSVAGAVVPCSFLASASKPPASSSQLPGIVEHLPVDVEVEVVKVEEDVAAAAVGGEVPHVPCGSAGSNFTSMRG